jgi:hypothetical protein
MSTKMWLIITPKRVFATYVKTIMLDNPRTWTNVEAAKAAICSYAMTFGSVIIDKHDTEEEWTSKEVFEFLKKVN